MTDTFSNRGFVFLNTLIISKLVLINKSNRVKFHILIFVQIPSNLRKNLETKTLVSN